MEITPVADAVVDSDLTAPEMFVVSSSVIGLAGDTLSAQVEMKWEDPDERLEQSSIRVYAGDATAANASLDTRDTCVGNPTLGAAVLGSCKAGLAYVTDEPGDGGETEPTETDGGGATQGRGIWLLPPGCGAGSGGSVSALWELTETTAGNPAYTFYAHVYGVKQPAELKDDARLDVNTASWHIQPYDYNWPDGHRPAVDLTSPLTTIKQGRWFAAVVHVDYPGADRPTTDMTCGENRDESCANACTDGNGNTTCSTASVLAWEDYDFYYVEDQSNPMASYASYSTTYNTGFLFMGGGAFTLTWDPAVLETNEDGGVFRIGGIGTKIDSLQDIYGALTDPQTDQMIFGASNLSNWTVKALVGFDPVYDLGAGFPTPMADGVDYVAAGTTTVYSGAKQGDAEIGAIALHAIGPVGSGSRMSMNHSGGSTIWAGMGNKTGTNAGAYLIQNIQGSNMWPKLEHVMGIGVAPTPQAKGSYNERVGWICITAP